MHKFEKANFNIDHYDETENYGKFVIEPLERGFGITLGNALRRVLLLLYLVLLFMQSKFKEQSMNFPQLTVSLKMSQQ